MLIVYKATGCYLKVCICVVKIINTKEEDEGADILEVLSKSNLCRLHNMLNEKEFSLLFNFDKELLRNNLQPLLTIK